MQTTEQLAIEACPTDLLAAYRAAATETDREAAAMAIARHHSAAYAGGAPSPDRYDESRLYCHWHGVASGHRANRVAELVPSPYDRPVAGPRDAACRFLWAYRAWRMEDAFRGSGGSGPHGGYEVEQRGGFLFVRRGIGGEIAARIPGRALWREMFGDAHAGGAVQIPLFAAEPADLDDLELMEDIDDE